MNLNKVNKKFLLQGPFYGTFCLGVKRSLNPDIPTACVYLRGLQICMDFNPVFMAGLSFEEKVFVMAHETCHLAFKHPVVAKLYGNHKLFNIAADCCINSLLADDGIGTMPEGGIMPELFELPNGKSTPWYYKELEKIKDDPDNPSHGKLQEILDSFEGHEWESFEVPKEVLDVIGNQIDSKLVSAYKGCSKTSSIHKELKEYIMDLTKVVPAVFDWKRYVSKFAMGNIDRYKKVSKKRPNKRFEQAQGRINKYKPSAVVYIDNSGSIDKEKEAFFSECTHLNKVLNFDVCYFDTKVHDPVKWNGTLPPSSGGTAFNPIKEHFNANDYSFGVILTDGYAEPVIGRFRAPVLWLCTTGVKTVKHQPGSKIPLKI